MSAPPSDRTRVRRYNQNARYDRETVHAILDAMPMCHIGYVFDGMPYVTPTLQWREGERVYWHGSSASRTLRSAEDADVCLTVALLDGLVCARSAYNFNVNYRSVMILGKAEKISDPVLKEAHLKTMMERFVPGHWDRLRPVTEQELKATSLLSMPITEASAKVRTGQPEDPPEDYAFPVWAGLVPIRQDVQAPIPDPRNLAGVVMPEDVLKFRVG